MSVQPFLIGEGWIEVLDGNDTARAIFDRHYSRCRYADGRRPALFVGPGEKLVLLTADADALAAWRREKHRFDGQEGVNCAIFRREAGDVASQLLSNAMAIAWERWPGERLFTFVDPRHVPPTMVKGPRGHLYPVWGYCFYQAGWRFSGVSMKGKHILDCRPEWVRP
ncbi:MULTISPECIES: hypothetical protein [unclassified Mesorhizobium]|uniref:hypothetical protein n=1 Tax=unclassified Mesorhizobium TaxID=325217 RepID=UPI000FCAB2AA|nr:MULTISPECIES: hypothetical protein [unclassified Mesorhizobium]RUV98350.1 hypothetical protein EOA49_23960 [Mesorhizobium sp. M1A.F.Ca.IN.020.04.1.1]RUW16314.1 hypothetical protein EOA53_00755 [Mesorhizobium sp. M1A.F.Ca.IN.020.03.1.1]RWF75306.1 MAG: hypothetical protein EOQ34_02345 [Mesorhizobium sp.]RWG15816.1 MAG: hypothetical protein EOQ58_10415 [Mesorhizobium sp.]RWG31392.1 MAG: hypothetical protein EOQ61_13350 [Mesorhizobium sp.]